MNVTTFSAKDLCVRSCMQIKMFTEHPDLRPNPSPNAIQGAEYQHKLFLSLPNTIGEEMRGSYCWYGKFIINFSNDIVCNDKIIEVKTVNKPVEEWYFKSSIWQCAVYYSLLMMSDRRLVTSTFYIEQGNPKIETVVDENIKYILYFGEDKYEIEVTNPYSIVDFIKRKAIASTDWQDAKLFDQEYKHTEFEKFNSCFKYKKI